ncbi:MAG TPA: CDP-alcohol phosphatidyltransferase family protein [Dissulfurispiraceae bacterium]|nr:CDP-alcohol phosphatidyltransferase family protein [Dissulfurispiraceae bacterium]
MTVLTIPNVVTFVRIVLIPVFVAAVMYQAYLYALPLFAAAGVSDALDGLLARLTGQKSPLGAFLDPLADKFLLSTSFILFSVYGFMPKWLTITVISRDIIITLGWLALYLIHDVTRVAPSILGKMANASQMILVAYILLDINFDALREPGLWAMWTVATLTIVSGLQYMYQAVMRADQE